jgi:hypothetical protein
MRSPAAVLSCGIACFQFWFTAFEKITKLPGCNSKTSASRNFDMDSTVGCVMPTSFGMNTIFRGEPRLTETMYFGSTFSPSMMVDLSR